MSSQLARLQPLLRARGVTADEVLFLSHTVDPQHDTPEVLRAYAERLGADPQGWTFLTGPDSLIYDLARHGYLATALPSDTAAGGFFHSDTFTLVDRQGRIRGVYDGTSTEEVDLLADHILQLLAQPEP
jgi:protein SCO1/2